MSGMGSLELGHQLCFALYAASNEIVRTCRPLRSLNTVSNNDCCSSRCETISSGE